MWSGGNSPIHWLVAPNKRSVYHPSRPSFCTCVCDGWRGDVTSTSSESFAVEVDPIDVDGCLDGVEEAPMVDGY